MLDRRDGAKYIIYINVSGIIFEWIFLFSK
jgi:hypothetical protein